MRTARSTLWSIAAPRVPADKAERPCRIRKRSVAVDLRRFVDAHLIVIRWIRCPSIVEKEIRIQWRHDRMETTGLSVEFKKVSQVSSGTCVRESERALPELENTLNEP